MRNALVVVLSLGCVACCCSIARTLERHYRQGYVGSAVMFARVLHEQSWGLSLLSEDRPIEPVTLSDLSTVRPREGGGK